MLCNFYSKLITHGRFFFDGQREEIKVDDRYRRVERSFGKFNRSFRIPDNGDPKKVQAACKDGQLIVTVAKTDEPRRKSIDISVS